MKKATKILAVVMAMVLCVCIGVGATLAWLTDRTEEVVNTFAPTKLINPDPDPHDDDKKAGFDIWEHKATTNADGSTALVDPENKKAPDQFPGESALVKLNKYERVLPGVDQMKDPFVRIKAQEDAYVYVEIVDKLPDTMTWAIDNANWEEITVSDAPHGGRVFKYIGTIQDVAGYITPGMGAQDINILKDTKVVVDKAFTPESLKPGQTDTLTFYAYAAQYAGQDTAEIAWNNAGFKTGIQK